MVWIILGENIILLANIKSEKGTIGKLKQIILSCDDESNSFSSAANDIIC